MVIWSQTANPKQAYSQTVFQHYQGHRCTNGNESLVGHKIGTESPCNGAG